MEKIEWRRIVPARGYYDVIVAGGGVAGISAALSAKRLGKKVLLLEKSTLLGGLATIGLVNYFVPMCNGRGRVIIRGMAEELLRLSIKYSYDSLSHAWANGAPDEPTQERYSTRFSPQIFALALTELLVSEGIILRYDSIASYPVMKDRHCQGVIVESKSGSEYYGCGILIDTTGDADLLFRAGVPTCEGENYFTYYGHGITLDSCRKAAESGNIRDAYLSLFGGTANLYGDNHPQNMPFYKGTSSESITDYLVGNQRLLLNRIQNDNRNSRDIITLPTMPQLRTTRRIDGDYTLTENDAYVHFSDSIGAICDFDHRDVLYEIPYRSMIHGRFDNLITAGRSVSSSGYAWDVTRVIPPAIISGQAAGIAAVHSLEESIPVAKVNIPRLQRQLQDHGVLLHFEDDWIPQNTNMKGSISGDENNGSTQAHDNFGSHI